MDYRVDILCTMHLNVSEIIMQSLKSIDKLKRAFIINTASQTDDTQTI